jgi:hypothetical protein
VLAVVPHSGIRLANTPPFENSYRKIVRIRRRWSYRITYVIFDDLVWVRFIEPSWATPSVTRD